MNIGMIKTAITKAGGRTGLILKAKSPEILLGCGIAAGVGSIFFACKATLHVEDLVDEHHEKIDKIHHAAEKAAIGEVMYNAETGREVLYTEDMRRKDLTVTYIQTSVNFLKLYWPAITLGTASLLCIVASHGIMKKRSAAMMAAYNVLEKGYQQYRSRVVAEHGEQADYMYKNNLYAEEVTVEEVDEEGKKKKVKKTVLKPIDDDPNMLSIDARWFDDRNPNWDKNAEYNKAFLIGQQNMFNNLLQARGHVFLSEVYDALGFERTQRSVVTGWIMGGTGDNFIDFGIFKPNSDKARDFVNCDERALLLDFNIDGLIFDKNIYEKRGI